MELRAPLTAVVAAALHRRRQLVRTAERADEQRHEQRDERLGALEQITALKVRAAGALALLAAIVVLLNAVGAF